MEPIIKNEIKKSYYAVIPANVRYDKRLCANAKLLYGEITALCNEKGYCWARNKYFADLYEVSDRSIRSWISKLIEYGYIKSEIKYADGSKEVETRLLYLPESTTPISGGTEKIFRRGTEKIFRRGAEENFRDNNTNNNNTNINISKKEIYKERKEEKVEKERDINFEQDNSNNNTVNICEKDINNGNSKSNKKNTTSKNASSCSLSKNENINSFNNIIDSYTDDEQLRYELKEHLKIRKKKKALTNHAIELSLINLDKIASTLEEKIEAVQRAIINGWTDFYEKKELRSNQKMKHNREKPSYDIVAAEKAADELFW